MDIEEKSARKPRLLSRLRPGEGQPVAGVDALLAEVRSYNAKADLKSLQRAYVFAKRAHEGQFRRSGEPYITHPLAVASILTELGLDTTTLQSALLHDTVEDTDVTLDDLEAEFGPDVAHIVDGLTKLDKIEFTTREETQAENVRKMIVAMAKDIRVLLIKLADRLHNMRTIGAMPPEHQEKKALETIEIYAPLAHRLGVDRLKWELEDLSFKTLHPGPYREIASLVEKRREERQEYIDEIIDRTAKKLRELGLKADVEGRPKHLYSIYEKMVVRGKEFDEIFDLVAVRVVTPSLRDCYAALGAVHSIWKPIPGRFKDYIAMPKENMYQSLHTTVVGPEGKPLEIQIRTRDMHRTSEFGIAAHWRYKEGKHAKDEQEMAWLAQMLEWLKDMADPKEFMEGLKIDLYGGQVFVFTPKGDVANLPAGATPIDFAYSIHTEVGHRCIGAKVNGKLVPLDYELRTGDTVDVLTSRAQDAGPSQDWERFVATPRARHKIRQWFSRERREDAMEAGREAVQRAMRKQNLPVKRLATEEMLAQVAVELKYPTMDAFYVAIGEGHVSPQSVIARLLRSDEAEVDVDASLAEETAPRHVVDQSTNAVEVEGADDVWVRLARCCMPLPEDEILGFVTRGQGVSVHRTDCPNAHALSSRQERLLKVSWVKGKPAAFVVAIQIEALDRGRLLGEVANVLSDHHVNILSATTTVAKDRIATLRFTFELGDIGHLSSLLSAAKRIDGVYDAYRVSPG